MKSSIQLVACPSKRHTMRGVFIQVFVRITDNTISNETGNLWKKGEKSSWIFFNFIVLYM